MTVPIIGYLILFNDSISQHISFDALVGGNLRDTGLSSGTRLKLIYFGLIFLGSANIVYRLRRPFVMRIGTDQFSYVEKALKHFTVSAYIDMHDVIRHEGHHTLHGKYYDNEYDSFLELALGKKKGLRVRDETTADWNAAKNKHEGLLRSILIENFFRNDIKRRGYLTLCLILSFVGYILLLAPSVDLFTKVLLVTFGT